MAKIDRADLLPKLADQFVVPREVAAEIERGPLHSPARAWLESNAARVSSEVLPTDPTVAAWDLGAGETAVLSFAHGNRDYESIVDDRAARACGAALGLRVRGTLGVLLLAKEAGLLHRIGAELDALERAGFRLGDRLRDTVLREAGEA
ncbi:MAG: DUF3368 domain-containing protein [Planctomycetes bacterium]|nr:DUF3368 domain-containing protein [Planctomycetota bacterium]